MTFFRRGMICVWQCSPSSTMIQRRPILWATAPVVPEPAKESRTRSPGLVVRRPVGACLRARCPRSSVFQQNPRLQLWPVVLADPGASEFLFFGHGVFGSLFGPRTSRSLFCGQDVRGPTGPRAPFSSVDAGRMPAVQGVFVLVGGTLAVPIKLALECGHSHSFCTSPVFTGLACI